MFHLNQKRKIARRRERGVTMPEMALGGVVFFTVLFGILEFGRGLTAYNTLSEAVRRGARYASTQPKSTEGDATETRIKNMVIYGTTTAGTEPVAAGLTATNVKVVPSTDYGLAAGTVKVGITGYQFNFVIPLLGSSFTMKPFWASSTAENAGIVPGNIP